MSDHIVSKQNTQLGFVGLGLMGSRFFRRLHADGWKVRGWNRSQKATIALKSNGLGIVDSLDDLVRGSNVLLSSLGDDDAVRLCHIREKVASSLTFSRGRIILEMSSISPDVSGNSSQQRP